MTKIENLKPGQSLLTSVKKVANDKVQVELVSFVQRGNINVAAIFNAGDERFTVAKPRRAWKAGTVDAISELFGIDKAALVALKEGESLEVGKLNPTIPSENGPVQLIVQIKEYSETDLLEMREHKVEAGQSTKNIDYLLNNVSTTAKKNPQTGDYIMVNGENVFSVSDIVAGKANHRFVVEHVTEVSATSPALSLSTL